MATSSQTSSVTATEPEQRQSPPRDAESQKPIKLRRKLPHHIDLLLNPSGICDEVLAYPYPGQGTESAPYIVDFLPNDPHNPMTFSRSRKWTITLLQAVATLAVAFVSTAYTGGFSEISAYFGVSTDVTILGVSLFVVGFAVGPLLWAPLSELYGRQILFFGTYAALTGFNAGAAAAPTMGALVGLRFFAGAFGSSPLTNAGGVIADMFAAEERGLATAVFALAPFLGPSIGPIAGGFLGEAAGWRWVEGLMAAFTGALWIACSVAIPETYSPVLLRRRADALSRLTGRSYVSKLDAGRPRKTVAHSFGVALSRPWKLLFREPIVALTSVYMSVLYGSMYGMFAAFPIVYGEMRGWGPSIGGLAFLGLAVGMTFSVFGVMFDNRRYARLVAASGGAAQPEARLPPAIVGSVLLPVGMFWFAWTNGPDIHWIVSIIATALFGAGMVLVFLSLMNYLIDSYVIFAASVLAANAVLRSLFGAAFPLFTTPMYENLGIHWAASIPAFLALACTPFTFLFYVYGKPIRMRCKYSAEAAEVLERMRSRHEVVDEDEAEEEVEEAENREREEHKTRAAHLDGVLSDEEGNSSGAKEKEKANDEI